MAKNVNEVITYFENLYKSGAQYVWGFNGDIINQTSIDKAYILYKTSTYNRAYYDNKLAQGYGKIGADCSGAMYPVSGFDATAKGYYVKCIEKGDFPSIPRDKACLVFKGKSTSSINHVGFYCGNGYVIEMKSSKENCVKTTLDNNGWKWWGIPSWIDYTSSTATAPASDTISSTNTPQTYIDVSSYQGNIDWSLVKREGITNAILKVIRKDLQPDKKFEQYWTDCQTAGINVAGVYNYSYATTAAKAKTDAQRVLDVLSGRKVKIWLDIEDKCLKGLGSVLKDIINTYQEVIESAGYEFGVYTGMSFYNTYIKPYASEIICTDWWIARYYRGYRSMSLTDSVNEQYNPKHSIGRDICGWQYTSSGQVPGINGNVDMNLFYRITD